MNKRLFLEVLLYWLLIFWILWSWALVLDEISNGPICPKLLWIPACYIILWAFISLLVLDLSKVCSYVFYAVVAVPISIALYGTVFQIFWGIECPKTDSWIPMCFISLALFSSIALLKVIIWKIWNE